MVIRTSYERLQNFWAVAQGWVITNEENPQSPKTKLGYAIQRMRPRVEKVFQKYQIARDDIDIENCATDKDGVILRDERGQLRHKPEALKKRNAEWQALFESEVEVECYQATELPKELTDFEKEAMTPFVIKEEAKSETAD